MNQGKTLDLEELSRLDSIHEFLQHLFVFLVKLAQEEGLEVVLRLLWMVFVEIHHQHLNHLYLLETLQKQENQLVVVDAELILVDLVEEFQDERFFQFLSPLQGFSVFEDDLDVVELFPIQILLPQRILEGLEVLVQLFSHAEKQHAFNQTEELLNQSNQFRAGEGVDAVVVLVEGKVFI